MHDISEHDSEEEWESHNSKVGWIDFSVLWNTIGVNNLLEGRGEFIRSNQSWFSKAWNLLRSLLVVKPSDSSALNHFSDFLLELEWFWAPNQALEDNVVLPKHIKMSVDGSLPENIALVDLEDWDIGILLDIGCHQILSEHMLRLSNDILSLSLVIQSGLKLISQSIDSNIKAVIGETSTDSSDLVFEDRSLLES